MCDVCAYVNEMLFHLLVNDDIVTRDCRVFALAFIWQLHQLPLFDNINNTRPLYVKCNHNRVVYIVCMRALPLLTLTRNPNNQRAAKRFSLMCKTAK